jgi:murein DD-endopeptidase MepM/ murein hydrolase activator NlpD
MQSSSSSPHLPFRSSASTSVSAFARSAFAASVLLGALLIAPSLAGGAPPPPCLLPPVAAARVIEAFREPPCPFCPGNRGLELAAPAGSIVGAAAAGRISFAGLVAGTRWVVVEHPGGFRTSYGRLTGSSARAGAGVRAGEPIGISTDELFFGLRLGEQYLDPAPHLAVVQTLPQLVPLDGANRRPPRPGRITCPNPRSTR